MITRARTTQAAYHGTAVPSVGRDVGFETAASNRRVTIGLGSRRFYIGVQSSHYRRIAKPPQAGSSGFESTALWRAMGYIGCASLALCMVIATGGVLRAAPLVSGYAVVLPIGDKAASPKPRHRAKPRRAAQIMPAVARPPVAAIADAADWSVDPAVDSGDVGLLPVRPDSDVATLPTTNGERAVAVYGPPRREGGKSCRDVSVFVRGTDGKVSMSPSVQCGAAR